MATSETAKQLPSELRGSRRVEPSPALSLAVGRAVAQVYGPDYTFRARSGYVPAGAPISDATSSRRHIEERGLQAAADWQIYAPDGHQLHGKELEPLAHHWVANYGSIGVNAQAGDSRGRDWTHLDLIRRAGDGSRVWFYGDPGFSRSSVFKSIGTGKDFATWADPGTALAQYHGYETIADFQKANGLKADGIVGPNTLAALRTATPAGSNQLASVSNDAPLPEGHPLAPRTQAYADVDNRLEKPMVTPDVVPTPQMTPRRLDLNQAPPLTPAPTGPVDVASLPPLAMPMPPSQAAMAPPSYQVASLAPDMPASMAPWNRTTATEVMPTVPKPASWNTSFPPQTNRQAQQDIISQMSPDWQQRAAQLGLGTAPPRTTPNVQIANVDPMVNQAADIYRQTMGAPMPGYLDAARESATYRPANIPAYTPASLVPPTPANRTPDTPATPSMPAYQPARMVPDTPARMVSDTPARMTAWDAPVPPSPFDQVASIAQPSVAASQPSATPSSPSVNDRLAQAQRDLDIARQTPLPQPTAAEQWQTTRTLPSDRFMAPPPMPAPISTPTPTTRTVTEQVINPEWQKWMDLQTAYPEADGIFGALPLGPDTYLRTSRAEPNKYIVKNNQVVERQPVPPMPNTQLPFPNGVPPTRSPVQQFFHTVLDGAHSLGSGNIGAMGGLFGNMVWRNTLPVPEQARLMQAGVNPTYGGYTPTAFHSALTKPSASGGPNYDYTTGTDASGNFKSTYTANNGNTYGISSWSDSFSAPPNSTPFEVSWG